VLQGKPISAHAQNLKALQGSNKSALTQNDARALCEAFVNVEYMLAKLKGVGYSKES
jgi:hypothetical protein